MHAVRAPPPPEIHNEESAQRSLDRGCSHLLLAALHRHAPRGSDRAAEPARGAIEESGLSGLGLPSLILESCESFGDVIFCVCVSEFIALILVPSLQSHFGILVM